MNSFLPKIFSKFLFLSVLFLSVSSWSQTYNQVTTTGGLVDGEYLIVGDSTNDGMMINTASATPFINYSAVSNPGATITTGYTSGNVFVVTVSSGVITIYNSSVGYVSWGRSGNTGNTASFYVGTVANTEQWSATVASGLWTLSNVATSTRLLQWNSGSPRFACYTSAQVKLKLYKKAVTGPTVTTSAATSITTTGADLNGSINANGIATDATFEYGTTTSYGTSVTATPATATGTTATSISYTVGSLSLNTQYHFRAVGTVSSTATNGTDAIFYTLAATPGVVVVNNPQLTTVDVTINATTENSNPSATEYAIQETGGQYVQADGSLGANAVWQTAPTWSTITVTGLSNSTAYTFQTKARNGDSVETSFGGTASATTLTPQTVDWCNLQYPTANTITEGDAPFTVYARVNEPGITNSPGEGTAIDAWIGYSTTNGTPDNTWTWLSASYFGDDGVNNDEYTALLGSGLTVGTYYYASRFSVSGGPYVYGGKNNAIWASTADSGILTVNLNTVNYANVQFPLSGTITEGDAYIVYAQVYEPGITPGAGQGAGITAEIGYSTSNTTPDGTWTWISTSHNASETGNNDEYLANIATGLTPGTYYYASRFIKSGSATYVYGGTAGVWNNDNGSLTVNPQVPVVTGETLTGTYGVAYTHTVTATNTPTLYTLASGTLPTGISLSTTNGQLSGTPTVPGSFSFTITATNAGGTSTAASFTFDVAKANQTITFGALANNNIGDAPYALTATASSGLTVTYTSSNPLVASVLGNTVTIVGAGTTTITASQAGDTNYDAAVDVLQTLSVNYQVIAQFDFSAFNATALVVTAKNANVSVSDFAISAGNITTGSTSGNNFPNEPMVEGQGGGWNSPTQAGAKNFNFNVTADPGYEIEISSFQFNALATAAGPSAFSYNIASGAASYTTNAPDTALVSVNETVTGLLNLTSVPVLIQGWLNGSRTSSGGGIFRIDDVILRGVVKCITPTDFTVTGGGSGCANTGVAIGLSGSQVGINYQLQNGGVDVGLPIAGSGSALTFGNQTIDGTYSVIASNPSGACASSLTMSNTVSVSLNPSPTIGSVYATSACSNTPSTVIISGLLPNTTGTLYYTNSFTGPVVYNVTGTSDTNGDFSFDTPNLPSAANGAVITITSGTVDATGCTTTFSGVTVTVSVGTTTTWSGSPASWSPSLPTSIDAAVISADYSEAFDLTACSLTINNNAVVSIPSDYNLILNGALDVTTGSTFTLENNANMLQESSAASNTGDISVKRFTSPLMRLDYVLWSSPVVGQKLKAFSSSTLDGRFYTYDSSTNFYVAVGAANVATTDFAAATGYLIRMPNNHPITPTAWENGMFTGVPHNGDYSITTTSGSYNAIGNPYPSTIDADTFIDDNGITEALYFWRKTNSALVSTSSYATYTLAGGTGTDSNPTLVGIIPSGAIQVGQGFIAKATSTSLSFNNGQRILDNNDQFLRLNNNNRSRIWLNLTTEGLFSQAMVAYMPTATNGVDAAIDGRPLQNNTTELASIINNEGFVIQGRAPFVNTDVVPLRLKAATAGNYTIAIDHVDGLFTNGQEIFLKDNVANTLTNLTNTNYQFATDAGMNDTRFEIVYQSTLSTQNPTFDANNMVIYKQNQFVVVNTGKTQMSKVKIYDTRGRLLIEEKDINKSEVKIDMDNIANQVLIVQVTTTDGTVVSKKVIN